MPPSIRLKSQRAVAMNLKEGAGYRSNQGMIWDDLALKFYRMSVHSETGAMADLFEGQKGRLVDCQVGAVFAINGEIAGLECFYHRHTFATFFPKLVESYALDAIDWYQESGEIQAKGESVRQFLEGIRKASVESYASLGLGENLRFQNSSLFGAALVHEGRVLQLSAFSHNGRQNYDKKVPFQRFSQRKKRT
jgi:hypothetical protein